MEALRTPFVAAAATPPAHDVDDLKTDTSQ